MKWTSIALGVAFGILGIYTSSCGIASTAASVLDHCQGVSFAQLQAGNSAVSDECRQALIDAGQMGQARNSLDGSITAIGSSTSTGRVAYFSGASTTGSAYSVADFQGATVYATVGGTETELTASDYSWSSISGSTDSLVSMSFVLDYSGSMRDDDITNVGSFLNTFVAGLSAFYEGEVHYFNSTVSRKLDFSASKSDLSTYLTGDLSYTRTATALRDGMGTALDRLKARSRPIKILVVSTDGLENSSNTYSEDDIVSLVNENQIYVVMLGAAFADVTQLRTLMGNHGVFIYVNDFTGLTNHVNKLTNSLAGASKLTLGAGYAAATSVRVVLSGAASSRTF